MELIAIVRGRLFYLVSVQSYTRKDGSASALAVWRGTCRVCGAAFELKTPAGLGSLTATRSMLRVHCDLHKHVRRTKQPGGADGALEKIASNRHHRTSPAPLRARRRIRDYCH